MQKDNSLPIGVALVGEFSYSEDCLVRIPVSIKDKGNDFFMKNPVKPDPEWDLNLLIRAIDFPENHPIKFFLEPSNTIVYWESTIFEKVAQSEFAEIFRIETPKIIKVSQQRQSKRIFCLTPVKCCIGENPYPQQCVCVDISQTGLGLKFKGAIDFPVGEKFKIKFEKPHEDFPELIAKVVRQNFNILDQTTSIGLVVEEHKKAAAQQIVNALSDQQSEDSFNMGIDEEEQESSQISSQLFNLFNKGI